MLGSRAGEWDGKMNGAWGFSFAVEDAVVVVVVDGAVAEVVGVVGVVVV